MDFKVILSPRAIQDLREIVRYISFDNPIRAESFGRELIGKTRLLASFPDMGRVVPEFGKQTPAKSSTNRTGLFIACDRRNKPSKSRAFGMARAERLLFN